MFYYDVAPFNVAEVPEPFNQGFEIGPLLLGTASVPKHPDYRNSSRLLRVRCERPCRSRATEQRYELAPSQLIKEHSVRLSARAELQDIELAALSQEVTERFYNLLVVGEGGPVSEEVGSFASLTPRLALP